MLTLMFDIVLILEHMTQIRATRPLLGTSDVSFRVPCCGAKKKCPSHVQFREGYSNNLKQKTPLFAIESVMWDARL